jgi:hypothetical protein
MSTKHLIHTHLIKGPTREEVFWSRCDAFDPRSKIACAEWLGHRLPAGYGTMVDPETGDTVYAHRMSWILRHGKEIPDGMVIRHLCSNPSCVRPSHLMLGTYKDNQADTTAAGRNRVLGSLSESDVVAIRHAYATERFSAGELSEMFFGTRAGQPRITRIVTGITYTEFGGPITRRGRGKKAKRRP